MCLWNVLNWSFACWLWLKWPHTHLETMLWWPGRQVNMKLWCHPNRWQNTAQCNNRLLLFPPPILPLLLISSRPFLSAWLLFTYNRQQPSAITCPSTCTRTHTHTAPTERRLSTLQFLSCGEQPAKHIDRLPLISAADIHPASIDLQLPGGSAGARCWMRTRTKYAWARTIALFPPLCRQQDVWQSVNLAFFYPLLLLLLRLLFLLLHLLPLIF